jgi:hypothetical protein
MTSRRRGQQPHIRNKPANQNLPKLFAQLPVVLAAAEELLARVVTATNTGRFGARRIGVPTNPCNSPPGALA